MNEEQKKELDQALLEALQTANSEDAKPEEIGAAIQASEMLAKMKNEALKNEAEIEKLKMESERIKSEQELSKKEYEASWKQYFIDLVVGTGALVGVLKWERFEIISSKAFNGAYGKVTKGFKNLGRTFRFRK